MIEEIRWKGFEVRNIVQAVLSWSGWEGVISEEELVRNGEKKEKVKKVSDKSVES